MKAVRRAAPSSSLVRSAKIVCRRCGVVAHEPDSCAAGTACPRCNRKGHVFDACISETHACGAPLCDVCCCIGHTDEKCPMRQSPYADATAPTPESIPSPHFFEGASDSGEGSGSYDSTSTSS